MLPGLTPIKSGLGLWFLPRHSSDHHSKPEVLMVEILKFLKFHWGIHICVVRTPFSNFVKLLTLHSPYLCLISKKLRQAKLNFCTACYLIGPGPAAPRVQPCRQCGSWQCPRVRRYLRLLEILMPSLEQTCFGFLRWNFPVLACTANFLLFAVQFAPKFPLLKLVCRLALSKDELVLFSDSGRIFCSSTFKNRLSLHCRNF